MPGIDRKSKLKGYAFRLKPHQDLKVGILSFAKRKSIHAGIVLTCVGSLEQSHLRFANKKTGNVRKGYFEILSVSGTFSSRSVHLHMMIADKKGIVSGGHILEGNLVYTTAEFVVGHLSDLHFKREKDRHTGYEELTIKRREK
jgi:uncharacterized protein